MYRSSPTRGTSDVPLLRISRPVAACSRCRRAKRKCDGKFPACTACEKSGHSGSCASSVDKFVSGSEKNYVAHLESRIEELEEKISLAVARKSSGTSQGFCDPIRPYGHKKTSGVSHVATHGHAARRREVADVNELVSDFGFLSVNATTQDFEKATTSMTFSRLILAATNNEPLPDCQPFRLPSKALTIALSTHYIENILSLTPIVSQTMLLDVIDAVYLENAQPVTDFEYWLLCMVLAISSASQSRNKLDEFYNEGVIWVGRALSFAESVLVPGYVSQIQALVLLVQYSMLDPVHFDSWNLIGFACRAVVDLGFHQDPPKEEQTDQKTLELRRTIFFCVYSLDRSISMAHARSFSFTDDSMSVALPSEVLPPGITENSMRKDSIRYSRLLFKFRMIQSSWYQELFQSTERPLTSSSKYIWEVCQEMQEWANSLPDSMPVSIKQSLDLELHYSFVYCLAPSSRVKAVSAYGKKLIFEFSISYIHNIAVISQNSVDNTFYTYHDALRVFFVGSQFASVLAVDQDQVLYSTSSLVSPLDDSSGLLSLHFDEMADNIQRSLNCIDQTKETLKAFSHRWEDCKVLLLSFETQVDHLRESLSKKKTCHI